jgi:hypothetical protein
MAAMAAGGRRRDLAAPLRRVHHIERIVVRSLETVRTPVDCFYTLALPDEPPLYVRWAVAVAIAWPDVRRQRGRAPDAQPVMGRHPAEELRQAPAAIRHQGGGARAVQGACPRDDGSRGADASARAHASHRARTTRCCCKPRSTLRPWNASDRQMCAAEDRVAKR